MADRPILFSGPMVRALLDGRKTQTRRVLKLPTKTFSGGPIYERPDMGGWEPTTSGGGGSFTIGKAGERIPAPERPAIWHRTTGVCMTIPFQSGDRLYVREAYRFPDILDMTPPRDVTGSWVLYEADGTDAPMGGLRSYSEEYGKFRQAMHMPRWASRLTLTVTDVRVQRLQEISEADARAEGLEWVAPTWGVSGVAASWNGDPRLAFAGLWDSLNAARGYGWDANPWIVALTFTVERRNMDGRA
jgi:hypothetical protein